MFAFEYELNRAWINDEDGESIGETNFVVPALWLLQIFKKFFSHHYSTFEQFLEMYEPETDGKFIYQKAIEDNSLTEDLGAVYYQNS